MTVPLTLLDTQWPGNLPELVPAIEEIGFHRYWASEHHSSWQSASPLMMAALAGSLTERIRIGTAGVMLRIAPVERVLADRAMLELFYPGRVDLGVVGAVPGEAILARHAADTIVADGAGYEARVRRLVEAARARGATSELWLCGKSVAAAELAGELGMRFAFHHYLAGSPVDGELAPAQAYQRAFRPGPGLDVPWLAIAAYGACGDRAHQAWEGHFAGQPAPRPSFLGDAATCAATIAGLARRYGARDVAIDCFGGELAERIDGLAAIARALA